MIYDGKSLFGRKVGETQFASMMQMLIHERKKGVSRDRLEQELFGEREVEVEQRQHSSWQGRVTWVEEGKTENFRSALELLKMIDGALDGMDIKEDAEEENQERAV